MTENSSNANITSARALPDELEQRCYYFNIRGDGRPGPKLIYRTSKDAFTPHSGPENEIRAIRLLQVGSHAQLCKDDLWAAVRDKVGELLDERRIPFTSIDLVRFGWDEPDEDGRRSKVTSEVTIWVGVHECGTTSEVALESSQDILAFLKQHGIDDVEVAFRESDTRFLSGPPLYAPVDDTHHLKNVIHSVTTALGLPIASETSPTSQGTMGFYFRIGKDLYGVTARHVLFDISHANTEYTYPSSPKKKVILMGTKAFNDLLKSIQAEIHTSNSTLTYLNNSIAFGKPHLTAELENTHTKIQALEDFFAVMQKDWSNPKDRVIGHVVWAPPITHTPPHGYTQDVCVIKLKEDRFLPNFVHNAISLGFKTSPGEFMSMMNQAGEPKFAYPVDRSLFNLQGILSATPTPVINSSSATIGLLNPFASKTRRYDLTGTFESIDVPVLNNFKHFGAFAAAGDSGAVVVGPKGEFVGLVTGGAGRADSESVDITYITPMHWLWEEVILAKFPGASLYFDEQ